MFEISKKLKDLVIKEASSSSRYRGMLCQIKVPVKGSLDEVLVVSPNHELMIRARPNPEIVSMLRGRFKMYAVIIDIVDNVILVEEVENVAW